MKRSALLIAGLMVVLSTIAGGAVQAQTAAADRGDYEVWIVDQSDTTPDGGGTLYIFQGRDLDSRHAASAAPEVIDLGGAARELCLAQTGTAPRRPHMMLFNTRHTHLVLAFVATGHVLFMDAETRAPIACLDAGIQAHAAAPSNDNRYVIVANQNGKMLQRINTDYATSTFTLDSAATLDLASCVTPSGAPCQEPTSRPDNAPICPILDSSDRLAFVTLRGGGLFVVDFTATPMTIVADYDQATIHPNGCGGVESGGRMFVNSGGGTAANPIESDLYSFRLRDFFGATYAPNMPAPHLIFSHDDRAIADSHGALLAGHNRYLWVEDRAANRIIVVDTHRRRVTREIDLTGVLSADPAPDLMGMSPAGNRVFLSLRGPNPLTGNAPGVNNAVGSTPGLGIVRVERNGQKGVLQAILPITHVVNGVELADPHGIAVRFKFRHK